MRDALKAKLREFDLVPIVFDWDKPTSRDLTETVALLASMSRFVVADITDAKSIPQELSEIVARLPSVPVQPILLARRPRLRDVRALDRLPYHAAGLPIRRACPSILGQVETQGYSCRTHHHQPPIGTPMLVP